MVVLANLYVRTQMFKHTPSVLIELLGIDTLALPMSFVMAIRVTPAYLGHSLPTDWKTDLEHLENLL